MRQMRPPPLVRLGPREGAPDLPKSDDTGGSERRARADRETRRTPTYGNYLEIKQVTQERLAAALAAVARVGALAMAAAVVR